MYVIVVNRVAVVDTTVNEFVSNEDIPVEFGKMVPLKSDALDVGAVVGKTVRVT